MGDLNEEMRDFKEEMREEFKAVRKDIGQITNAYGNIYECLVRNDSNSTIARKHNPSYTKKLDVWCLRDLLYHYFRELNGAGHQSPLSRDQALKNAVAYLEGHLSDFLNSIKNKLLPSAGIKDAEKRQQIEPAETWARKMLDWTQNVLGKLDENQEERVESVILHSAKQCFGSLIRQTSPDLDANARPSGETTTLALPLAIWLADHNKIIDCLEFTFRGRRHRRSWLHNRHWGMQVFFQVDSSSKEAAQAEAQGCGGCAQDMWLQCSVSVERQHQLWRGT